MSRRNPNENLNAVQLFPFVAVLLCTMGSLLVLLVGVARSSRDRAHEEAVALKARAAAGPPVDPKLFQILRTAAKQVAALKKREGLASEQLRNDQLQLSHLE